jgi:hypothetical protein
MDNPETFMGNIEQEWTIQRHSWATLSKNGQSRDIHNVTNGPVVSGVNFKFSANKKQT